MNTLDMQTREKVNQINLDEMQQDARNRRMAGGRKPATISVARIRLVLIALLLALFMAFFVSATPSF